MDLLSPRVRCSPLPLPAGEGGVGRRSRRSDSRLAPAVDSLVRVQDGHDALPSALTPDEGGEWSVRTTAARVSTAGRPASAGPPEGRHDGDGTGPTSTRSHRTALRAPICNKGFVRGGHALPRTPEPRDQAGRLRAPLRFPPTNVPSTGAQQHENRVGGGRTPHPRTTDRGGSVGFHCRSQGAGPQGRLTGRQTRGEPRRQGTWLPPGAWPGQPPRRGSPQPRTQFHRTGCGRRLALRAAVSGL